ncbi:MAG TPA: hypothetical protein VNG12_17920 [Acidimicrobiales bacterium]|nr:hypothetical protein [Acidimicrobiales bacterium]
MTGAGFEVDVVVDARTVVVEVAEVVEVVVDSPVGCGEPQPTTEAATAVRIKAQQLLRTIPDNAVLHLGMAIHELLRVRQSSLLRHRIQQGLRSQV